MARQIGSKTDNGWVIEKLEVSDRIYEKINSSKLFEVYMLVEERKWVKDKVYRKYYKHSTKSLIVMFEFSEKDNLLQRVMVASHEKNPIKNII